MIKLKKTLITTAAIAAFVIRSRRLSVVKYEIFSDKVRGKVRLALMADLHSHTHGKNQRKLIAAIEAHNPDAVLMAGDIADHITPHRNTKILLRELAAKKYPVYYVSGNHEYKGGEIEEIKRFFRRLGANVLEGCCREIIVGDNRLTVCGVDDVVIGAKAFHGQLQNCASRTNRQDFSVLLAHRPEKMNLYAKLHFDLILSGHVHGGQVRIPRITNGIYAIHQGFFPKYVGGLYHVGGNARCKLIVSRGLSKSWRGVPRVFNPPELVIIDIVQKRRITPL
ncbi:MAG: metallophosphoesterase [Oscillospiraceae bacterium]|nr:metallophosphoesterase [Oscillospiraceae bacterium]